MGNSSQSAEAILALVELIKDLHWRHHETAMRVIDLEFQVKELQEQIRQLNAEKETK